MPYTDKPIGTADATNAACDKNSERVIDLPGNDSLEENIF
jgi:hypothetical protein